MKTKTSTLLDLLNPNLRTISVKFRDTNGQAIGRCYTYKTLDDSIVVGDAVVVDAPHGGFVVVNVVEVHETAMMSAEDGINYKWIVCKVDATAYYDQLATDEANRAELERMQRIAQKAKAAEKLRKELGMDGVDCPELDALVARLSGK